MATMLSPAPPRKDKTVRPGEYTIMIIGTVFYAIRSDGSKVITAGDDPDRLQAAIDTDRGQWHRPRLPLSRPAA